MQCFWCSTPLELGKPCEECFRKIFNKTVNTKERTKMKNCLSCGLEIGAVIDNESLKESGTEGVCQPCYDYRDDAE